MESTVTNANTTAESADNSSMPMASNEDIISELTKEFENKLSESTQENSGSFAPIHTGDSKIYNTEEDSRAIVEEALAGGDKQEDEEDISLENEIAFKELESTWSEEEKQNHKDESQRLKAEGNRLFTEKNYKQASRIYSQALMNCPLSFTNERSVLYSNRAACKVHQEKKKEAIEDCTKALELNPNYLKALLRRAQLNRETEKLDESLADYQKVLEIDGNIPEARQAVMMLPEEIKERNEKLKTEMMGKLKELGNVVLRPFGLSTENFKFVQDPNTGGYSINFQKNT